MTHKFPSIWAKTSSNSQTERTETFGMMLGKSYVSAVTLCHRRKHAKLTKMHVGFQTSKLYSNTAYYILLNQYLVIVL